jgi:ribonuclease HII
LKDDFEEVLLKAGWTYKTSFREPRDTYIRGRLVKKENQKGCFEIRLRRNNKITCKFLHKSFIPYKGKVFCLSLPEHHNFFVRRSGTGYFTGNCGAGPVTAGAVWIPRDNLSDLLVKVRDSKALSEKRREVMFELIDSKCKWAVASVDNEVIDEINILNATKLAMKKAIMKIERSIDIDHVLIDGTVVLDGFWLPQTQIIRGDSKSVSIAAASIMAKVMRDDLMQALHNIYPQYGWVDNKGYLTPKHIKALEEYGPCEYHRLSFNKVGELKKMMVDNESDKGGD